MLSSFLNCLSELSSSLANSRTPLWFKPEITHENDEEFEQNGIPEGWQLLIDGTTPVEISSGSINLFQTILYTDAVNVQSHLDFRKSFICLQLGGHHMYGDPTPTYIFVKPFLTSSDSYVIYTGKNTINDGDYGGSTTLALFGDIDGQPDVTNQILIASSRDISGIFISGSSYLTFSINENIELNQAGFNSLNSLEFIPKWMGFTFGSYLLGASAPIFAIDFIRQIDTNNPLDVLKR